MAGDSSDNGLDPEEASIWARVTRSVRPLPGRYRRRFSGRDTATGRPADQEKTRPRPAETGTAPSPAGPAPIKRQAESRQMPSPARPPDFAGLDARTAQRLRRGRIAIDARLDLHGLRRAEARELLAAALEQAEEEGKRCLCVVTGKGDPARGTGVIRESLPGWLNGPANKARVLAWCLAAPKDGGAGAFYVLLRRRRPARG